jgi:hypothetical protein
LDAANYMRAAGYAITSKQPANKSGRGENVLLVEPKNGPRQKTCRFHGGGRSHHRTCLSLHSWEMQGDFSEMQGGG